MQARTLVIASHDRNIETGSVARRNETQLALRYGRLEVGSSPELVDILAPTISVDQTGSALTGHEAINLHVCRTTMGARLRV